MFKKQIPNCITLLNLLSGCFAILFAFESSLSYAVFFMVLGAIFDFFDGMTARLLKVQSPIGKELDSLADVVTFGVVPGILAFISLRIGFSVYATCPFSIYTLLPFLAFLIPLFSAYRLAKFNIDERQTSSFIGLPTPANGLFWGGLILINDGFYISNIFTNSVYPCLKSIASNPWFLLVMAMLLSVLLVSEIPLFALKFKKFTWKGNEVKFIFLGISLLLLVFFNVLAIPFIVTLYILISLITKKQTT